MRDLNVKIETTKFLEEHSGKTRDVGFGNYLLDLTPKAQETKIKLISTELKTFMHQTLSTE